MTSIRIHQSPLHSQQPVRSGRIRRIAAVLGALLAVVAVEAAADDTDIFSRSVPPNVLLFVDNSGSMSSVMYHPSFIRDDHPFPSNCNIIPSGASGTTNINDDQSRSTRRRCASSGCRLEVRHDSPGFTLTPNPDDHPDSGYIEREFCGQERKLYYDGTLKATNDYMIYYEQYVEWLFTIDDDDDSTLWGPSEHRRNADDILEEIDDTDNGRHFITGDQFAKFQRSRITAAREIATDVIYQTNTDCPAFLDDCGVYEDRVRFGIGVFHRNGYGGYVKVDVDTYSNNRTKLATGIAGLSPEGSTPLAESLFKLSTYFMSRTASERPYGVLSDGSTSTTRFPEYVYKRSNGDYTTTSSDIPPDPVQAECQKNFIILITDGEPTSDTFGSSSNNKQSFGVFKTELVGDYAPDTAGDEDYGTDSTPEEGNPPWGSSGGSGYLDDIALFMQDKDIRPDMNGDQHIDVYTVGFGTFGPVNKLLEKTAANGNGLYFNSDQAEELTDALVKSIQDIISKSQGFAAATVPAARTSTGGGIYTSLFKPSNTSGFWRGFIRRYLITAGGDVLDKNGACALVGGTGPTDCKGGAFQDVITSPPFWDAGEVMPDPNNRTLKVSLNGSMTDFDHSLTQADLTLGSDISLYPVNANVTTDSDLDEAVVSFAAGCEYGTGLSSGGGDDFQGCVPRTEIDNGNTVQARLGDVFHSSPVVIGAPAGFVGEASYKAFANDPTIEHRDRFLYVGANDGFLHAFDAGTYQAAATPPDYDAGTGVEEFAFMPWEPRKNVKKLSRGDSLHEFYVDGDPSAADVWIDSNTDNTDAKLASEWSTVLIGGLRGGGRHYFALDVTDPSSGSYPGYLWEFPAEDDPDDTSDPDSFLPYMGETWSRPIITKVRVEEGSDVFDRWVAIIGFGYHPSSDPVSNPNNYNVLSLKGRGVAMIDIATGEPLAVRRFGLGTGQVPGMLFAIAATPGVLDMDSDGYADVAYFPDVGGNVWKWVFKTPGIADPTASELHQPNWSFRKFFEASPLATSHPRSFYFPPSATLVNGKLHLALGTGEREDLLYPGISGTSIENNRWYVVVDSDWWDYSGSSTPINGLSVTEGGQLTDVTPEEDDCPVTQPEGFLFELPDGEKFTTNSEIFNGFVFVSTFTPPVGGNVCDANGTSKLYGFLVKCGQGFFGNVSTKSPIANEFRTQNLGDGFSTDPRLSIAPGDGGNRLIISKSDGSLINEDGGESEAENGQLYWRELDR